MYQNPPKPHTHFTVLTDVSGSRHYAVILKVYQAFYASKVSINLLFVYDSMLKQEFITSNKHKLLLRTIKKALLTVRDFKTH